MVRMVVVRQVFCLMVRVEVFVFVEWKQVWALSVVIVVVFGEWVVVVKELEMLLFVMVVRVWVRELD